MEKKVVLNERKIKQIVRESLQRILCENQDGLQELANKIINSGLKRITENDSELFNAIDNLSDYDLSRLNGLCEEQGYALLWDIFSNAYELEPRNRR